MEGKREEREVAALLRYLESWDERFEEPEEEPDNETEGPEG